MFLALSVTFLFVCESNMSGTAERICAKFISKTCLVPRSEEFECQGQRSKVNVTRDKNALCTPITPRQRRNGTANNVMQQQTGPLRRCRGMISAAYVRFLFGKTSLALVSFLVFFITHVCFLFRSLRLTKLVFFGARLAF